MIICSDKNCDFRNIRHIIIKKIIPNKKTNEKKKDKKQIFEEKKIRTFQNQNYRL